VNPVNPVRRQTILGAATGAPSPSASIAAADTILGRAVASTPRGELVKMPLIGSVWVELVGEMVSAEIESATIRAMSELSIPFTPIHSGSYERRQTALTLAWAVRHPDSDKRHICAGTQEQWCAKDNEFLAACIAVYTDVRERLNPLSYPLSSEEFDQIRLAHEKKNPAMLRTFGVVSLSSYLATTDAPPASSPTAPPSSGP
jgi:hypothetical protein